jgi:hypothetical protein
VSKAVDGVPRYLIRVTELFLPHEDRQAAATTQATRFGSWEYKDRQ